VNDERSVDATTIMYLFLPVLDILPESVDDYAT